MLEELKEKVFESNQLLSREQLVVLTWGNASAYDSHSDLVVIKPSGVSYDSMTPQDMVVLDLEGKVIEGKYRPSSDTPTHLALYRNWGTQVQGIVHTHSTYATVWAQSGRDIPIQGTTHADYFYGDIPCLPTLTVEEVAQAYEHNTGIKILAEFKVRELNPVEMPACLLTGHGPFTWGSTVEKAVENSIVLEAVAKMATYNYIVNPKVRLPGYILNKHYLRKHGKDAYYGQK